MCTTLSKQLARVRGFTLRLIRTALAFKMSVSQITALSKKRKKKDCIRERRRKKISQFGTESTRPLPRVPGPTSLRRELLIPIHDTENRCLQVESAAKRSMQIESPQSHSVLRRVIKSASKLSYFFFRFFNVRSMYTSPQLSINLFNYAKIISVGAYIRAKCSCSAPKWNWALLYTRYILRSISLALLGNETISVLPPYISSCISFDDSGALGVYI